MLPLVTQGNSVGLSQSTALCWVLVPLVWPHYIEDHADVCAAGLQEAVSCAGTQWCLLSASATLSSDGLVLTAHVQVLTFSDTQTTSLPCTLQCLCSQWIMHVVYRRLDSKTLSLDDVVEGNMYM